MKYRYLTMTLIMLLNGFGMRGQQLELSLAECRRLALENSEDMQMANNDIAKSELDYKIANTALLPKVDGSASGMYMLPNMDMSLTELQMRGTFMAGVSLVQPIYTGGKITAGRNLAKIGKKVADLNIRKTRMDVIAEADNAYWTYMAVKDKVVLLESYYAMLDTIYRQTEIAVNTGMTIENDLLRVEARRSDIKYQLQKAINGEELCRLSLCRIIGVDFETHPVLTDTEFENKAPGHLDTDISERPELGLLDAGVMARQQDIKMVRSDFLPTVGLSLGYTYYGNVKMKGQMQVPDGSFVPYTNSLSNGFGIAMLSVSIPLFHWGEGLKKVRKAKIELQNFRLELDKNRQLMSIQAIQAAKNYEDGFKMIETARIALTQAEENLRVMRNRYEASMLPLTDLLDAQTQWQQSSSDYIEAQAQYRIYEIEYLRCVGKLQ